MSVIEVATINELELQPNCVYVIAPDRKLEITANDDRRGVVQRSARAARGDRCVLPLARRKPRRRLRGGACRAAAPTAPSARAPSRKPAASCSCRTRRRRRTKRCRAPSSRPRSPTSCCPSPTLAARLVELVRHGACWRLAERASPRTIAPRATRPRCGASSSSCVPARATTSRATSGRRSCGGSRGACSSTIARRFDHYLALLRENPEEIQALFDDLLISVTTFFRDPAAWEALRMQVVVPLVERAPVDEPFRVWVPGCATGEEAYTLAILFREELSRRDIRARARDLRLGRRPRRAGDGARRHLSARDRRGRVGGAARALFPRRGRPLPRHQRDPRLGRVRGAQRAARPAVLEAALDLVPQRLDLSRSRAAAATAERVPLRFARRRFSSARRFRGGGPRAVRAARQAEPAVSRPRSRELGPPARLPQLPDMPQVSPAVERVRERAVRVRRSAAELHIETLEEFAPPSVLVDEHWNIEHLSETAGRFLQQRGGPPAAYADGPRAPRARRRAARGVAPRVRVLRGRASRRSSRCDSTALRSSSACSCSRARASKAARRRRSSRFSRPATPARPSRSNATSRRMRSCSTSATSCASPSSAWRRCAKSTAWRTRICARPTRSCRA